MKETNLIIKLIQQDNGQIEIQSNESEWQNPFELLGILNYVKTSLEVKLVQMTQSTNNPIKEQKRSFKNIKIGDFMKCVRINVQSRNNPFTVGNLYEVIDLDKDYRGRLVYWIYDNNLKKRSFQAKNSQFVLFS